MCDKHSTAFSVTLGPRILMPCFMQLFLCKVCSLNGMLVPFFTTVGCSLVPSSLLTVSVTQQENKSIDYLCIGMVEAVKFLSFPHFLHV